MLEVCHLHAEDVKEKLSAQHQATSGQASCLMNISHWHYIRLGVLCSFCVELIKNHNHRLRLLKERLIHFKEQACCTNFIIHLAWQRPSVKL